MRIETRTLAAAVAILALGACKDVGLEGLNTPLEEARNAPPLQASVVRTDAGADAANHVGPVRLGNQRWIPSGEPIEMDATAVQSVGSAAGRIFYAFTWDEPPYDRLLAPARDGEWQEYTEVYAGLAERGEAAEAGEAAAGEAVDAGEADQASLAEEDSI